MQICRQLEAAFGEQRLPKLTLIADPSSRRIAQFVSVPEPELFLDEKMYDLCRQFGPDSLDALAIVLGHELAHYYGRHTDWFGFAQLARHQQPTLKQTEQTQVLEKQADMQGVYRAFLAGYDAYRIARPLYESIYRAYQLPARMSGYPDRDQRIASMVGQASRAGVLGIAFETGLFFLLKRDYSVARRCFEFVSAEMPTKEALSNTGLCLLLQAAQTMTLTEQPFRYPVLMETANRLRPNEHRGDDLDRTDLLKRAGACFQQAIDLDESYTTAYLNLATTLSLLGRPGTAKELIDQLDENRQKTGLSLPADARQIRGIALIETGRTADGLAEIERSTGAAEQAYNLAVARQYTDLSQQPSARATELLSQIAEKVIPNPVSPILNPEAKSDTSDLLARQAVVFSEKLAIPEPDLVRIRYGRSPDSIVYKLTLADAYYTVVASRLGRIITTSRGVRLGDSTSALTQQYGRPDRTVSTSDNRAWYIYDADQFFVQTQNGTVVRWISYARHP